MDTTIKVDAAVRDRLLAIARERGCTLRELMADLAEATLTQAEVDARHATAAAYVRQHLAPELTNADLAGAEARWKALENGTLNLFGDDLPRSAAA